MDGIKGHVFWLFGLSGAGKSTLAEKLREGLVSVAGRQALMLDGDRLRNGLSHGLGFSDEDRTENLRRAAEVARLGLESGLVVIAAFITPRETQRQMVESIIGANACSLILLDASLEVCQRRDVKGLYGRAAAGRVEKMTGMTSIFDATEHYSLRVQTGSEPLDQSVDKLTAYARRRLASA